MNLIVRALLIISMCAVTVMAVPAKKADTNDKRSDGDKIGALCAVVAFGALGGFLLQAI